MMQDCHHNLVLEHSQDPKGNGTHCAHGSALHSPGHPCAPCPQTRLFWVLPVNKVTHRWPLHLASPSEQAFLVHPHYRVGGHGTPFRGWTAFHRMGRVSMLSICPQVDIGRPLLLAATSKAAVHVRERAWA